MAHRPPPARRDFIPDGTVPGLGYPGLDRKTAQVLKACGKKEEVTPDMVTAARDILKCSKKLARQFLHELANQRNVKRRKVPRNRTTGQFAKKTAPLLQQLPELLSQKVTKKILKEVDSQMEKARRLYYDP